jgi:putative addiction module killer protein
MRVEQTDPFREVARGAQGSRRQGARAGAHRSADRRQRGQAPPARRRVSELKIDVGPGYRVYYALRGSTLLLLLAAGDKSTQQKDIAAATRLAREFLEW